LGFGLRDGILGQYTAKQTKARQHAL